MLSKRVVIAVGVPLVAASASWALSYRRGEAKARWQQVKQGILGTLQQVLRSRDTWLSLSLLAVAFALGTSYVSAARNAPHLLFIPSTGPATTAPWICGAMLGIAAALCYGIFRIGMNRTLAWVCGVLFATSPYQLYILCSSPERDYPRGPFILLILFLLALTVRFANTQRRLFWLASALGLTAGMGSYFREELPLFVLPSTFVILFLIPKQKAHGLMARGLALLGLAFFFGCTVPRPIIQFGSINTTAGFMTPLDGQLGLTRPAYDLGYLFQDGFIAASSNLVADSKNGVGEGFIHKYLTYFPGDFIVRIYAAAIRLLDLPFLYQVKPQALSSGASKFFYDVRACLQELLANRGIFLAVAAASVLGAIAWRFAVFYGFLLFYWAAMFTVQFWGKNYSYMEYFSWWTFGFLIQQAVTLAQRWRANPAYRPSQEMRRLAVGFAGIGVIVLGMVSLLGIVRQAQTLALTELFDRYLKAPLETETFQPQAEPLHTPFVRADFSGESCPTLQLRPVLAYANEAEGGRSWTRTLSIDIPGPKAHVSFFFPALIGFTKIELPKDLQPCLTSFHQLKSDVPLPLRLSVLLPQVPSRIPWYQQLEQWEVNRDVQWPTPPDRALATEAEERYLPATDADIDFRATLITPSQTTWIGNGIALPPRDPHLRPDIDRSRSTLARAWNQDISVAEVDTDLLITRARKMRRGNSVLVKGVLKAGGLRLGLVRDGAGVGPITFSTPGPFQARFEIPTDGEYRFGIANHLFWYTTLENRFTIQRIAWSEE